MSDRVPAAMLALVWAAVTVTTASAQEPRLRDPMRPVVTAGPDAAAPRERDRLSLTAVLVSDSRRIAVVNGRIYHVGDRVDGEEIVAIEPGLIRIRRGGGIVLVRVRENAAAIARNDGEQGQ